MCQRAIEDIKLMCRALGLTFPWAPVDYPIAVKLMKTALEQGANLWNGVRLTSEWRLIPP